MGDYLGDCIETSILRLKTAGQMVDAGRWQGVPTEGKPDLVTKEILNLSFAGFIPLDMEDLIDEVNPNMPWAETEFQERVSGHPFNPHTSLTQWPWWHGQEGQTMTHGMFSHTYSERFWPKHAGLNVEPDDCYVTKGDPLQGIRYPYGDLEDVVILLQQEPFTRQATFPIFFPEDTGAVHGGRIPCTLHYHFLRRGNNLHLWYAIRSCDAVRHFRDDVYMAARLLLWMIERLTDDGPWEHVVPGDLYFTAYSFHVHMGDYHLL